MQKQNFEESRRGFLKSGIAGVIGGLALPDILISNRKEKNFLKDDRDKILYRTLGKTGVKVPVISFGCNSVSDPAIIKSAMEKGIIYFDTAHTYENGRSEESIAEAVKGLPRDSFIVSTKSMAIADPRTGLYSEKTNVKAFIDKIESSIKTLGVDYLDILFLHNVVKKEAAFFEPLVNALLKLKKEGKTRFIGVSFHKNEPELLRAVADDKRYDVALCSYNFRQPHREEVKKAIEYAAKAGLGVIAMKAMAGVYWDSERTKPINSKAALKWVLQDENVSTVLSGMRNYEQIEINREVMIDPKLTPEEKNDLQFSALEYEHGFYCAQCDKCIPQCRMNLDIPSYMRSYMYAFAYKKPSMAKKVIMDIPSKEKICVNCEECRIKCTMGFNVREKIQNISRLKNIPDEFLA